MTHCDAFSIRGVTRARAHIGSIGKCSTCVTASRSLGFDIDDAPIVASPARPAKVDQDCGYAPLVCGPNPPCLDLKRGPGDIIDPHRGEVLDICRNWFLPRVALVARFLFGLDVLSLECVIGPPFLL